MQIRHEYKIKPRHTDIDEYGIAHHSKFLCWFEEARYDMFQNYKDILKSYKLLVSKMECKYMRQVYVDNELLITVSVEIPLTMPKLSIYYRLTDSNRRLLYAKAYTEHVFLDKNNKMATEINDDIKILNTLADEV